MSDIKDLAVKVGSYTDREGNTKSRYENIGKLMQGSNGPYLLIKRTFNPAGVPAEDGRDMIVVSVFEQRERNDAPRQSQQSAPAPQPQTGGPVGTDDDIPF